MTNTDRPEWATVIQHHELHQHLAIADAAIHTAQKLHTPINTTDALAAIDAATTALHAARTLLIDAAWNNISTAPPASTA